MRWQLATIAALAACGHKGDGDSGGNQGSAGCPASRFAIELADEKAALMKALYDHVDHDPAAPKMRVYPQLDEWKDAAGTAHAEYRLAGSDRATIAGYLAVRAQQDPKLAAPADRAFRFEKTFAAGRTYWRTHYVVAPPLVDGTAIAGAEVAPSGAQIVVRLTADGAARLAAATAAHTGAKLALRAGDTVMGAPTITAPLGDRLILVTAEETPELAAQVAAQTAKQLACGP